MQWGICIAENRVSNLAPRLPDQQLQVARVNSATAEAIHAMARREVLMPRLVYKGDEPVRIVDDELKPRLGYAKPSPVAFVMRWAN